MGSNGYFDALAVSTSAFCVIARLRLWERRFLRLACWIGASLFDFGGLPFLFFLNYIITFRGLSKLVAVVLCATIKITNSEY
nr:hypothetical protein [uncultured Campylobacter sp.]